MATKSSAPPKRRSRETGLVRAHVARPVQNVRRISYRSQSFLLAVLCRSRSSRLLLAAGGMRARVIARLPTSGGTGPQSCAKNAVTHGRHCLARRTRRGLSQGGRERLTCAAAFLLRSTTRARAMEEEEKKEKAAGPFEEMIRMICNSAGHRVGTEGTDRQYKC